VIVDKNKSLVWFTLFAFFLSVGMGVMVPPQPALAGGGGGGASAPVDSITEMADQIRAVYVWLNDSDKQAIRDARTNAINMSRQKLKDIVAPLLTPEVESRFDGSAAAAEDALIDFARDYSEIYYPADGDWESKLRELRDEAVLRGNFQKLMGYGTSNQVTFDELIELAKDTKELTPGVVKNDPRYLSTVLSKNDQELSSVMYEIAETAVREAVNRDQQLKQRLLSLEWTADILTKLQKDLSLEVDPQHKADLALLYGYIRSKTKLVYENGQEPEVYGGDAYSLDPGKLLKVMVLGRDLGQIGIRVTDSNSNVMNWPTDDRGYLVVPNTPGSFIIFGYRNYSGAVPETSYILMKNVFIFDDAALKNADLAEIRIGGKALASFHANTLEYIIPLKTGDPIPSIDPKVATEGATYEIGTSLPNQTQTVKKIIVTAPDRTTQKEYKVVFIRPVATTPDKIDTVDWNNTPNIELTIPAGTDPKELPITTITIPSDVPNPTLTIAPDPDIGKAVWPNATIQSNGAQLSIPGGLEIQGPADWDGTLELPKVAGWNRYLR
jgi:flagellin-specific chaperone FliS